MAHAILSFVQRRRWAAAAFFRIKGIAVWIAGADPTVICCLGPRVVLMCRVKDQAGTRRTAHQFSRADGAQGAHGKMGDVTGDLLAFLPQLCRKRQRETFPLDA